MNITDEVKKKDLIKIVKVYEENELEPIVKKEKTNKKIIIVILKNIEIILKQNSCNFLKKIGVGKKWYYFPIF